MKTGSKALRILEHGLLLLGLLLLVTFAFARIHRFIMCRAEMAKFEARQLESPKESDARIEGIDGGKTASLVPLAGLLGFLSMALYAGLRIVRRNTT
jgi:hypothetical protein